jgi:hypothetical protein
MIGEGEPLQNTDGPSKLDLAKEAVQAATQTVKETTQSVADAIEAGRRPGAPLGSLGSRSASARGHCSVPGRFAGGRPQVIRLPIFAP